MNILASSLTALVCAIGAAIAFWVNGAGAVGVFSAYVIAGVAGLLGALCVSARAARDRAVAS